MPDANTRGDAIGWYLTGASSDGGSQTDPDQSLGNYRSSTRVDLMTVTRGGSPISNITVVRAGIANGEGTGTLECVTADTIRWTAPGGSAGSAVAIANGETKLLEDGGDPAKFIVVSRTSADDLTGSESVTLAYTMNNAVGFDNVTSSEASSGDDEYRCICAKNESASAVTDLKVWLDELGTAQTTDDGQLASSGAGTIETTGSFEDWPEAGMAYIEDSGGSLVEIVYYSSRTNTALTVPAAGRGALGTSAAAGSATDVVRAISPIRLGKEAPTGNSSTGNFTDNTASGEDTAPAGVTFVTPVNQDGALSLSTSLGAGEIMGLWIHREVIAGATSLAEVLNAINVSFSAS